MRLDYPNDAVVVVAGVPGAGKTTLIRRTVDRGTVQVLDTDDRRRAPGAKPGRARLYLGHYARIVRALLGHGPVVVHTRGTHAVSRGVVAALATLRGRPAHLLLLDADRAEAVAGQVARGRRVGAGEMDRQLRRWGRLVGRLERGRGPWASVLRLDRATAAQVTALEFAPPLPARGAAVVAA